MLAGNGSPKRLDSSMRIAAYLFIIAGGLMGALLCFIAISGWFQRKNGPGAGHMGATWNSAKVDMARDLARLMGRRAAEEQAAALDKETPKANGDVSQPKRRL